MKHRSTYRIMKCLLYSRAMKRMSGLMNKRRSTQSLDNLVDSDAGYNSPMSSDSPEGNAVKSSFKLETIEQNSLEAQVIIVAPHERDQTSTLIKHSKESHDSLMSSSEEVAKTPVFQVSPKRPLRRVAAVDVEGKDNGHTEEEEEKEEEDQGGAQFVYQRMHRSSITIHIVSPKT